MLVAVSPPMCHVSPPPGQHVRCVSTRVSHVDRHWGRVVFTYVGGGAGTRRQRVNWLHRTTRRWRLKTAVVGAVGSRRPPCGQVPVRVLREFYGRTACR